MDLVEMLKSSGNKSILFAAIEKYDKPKDARKFYKDYVLFAESNRKKLVRENANFLYLSFPEKDRENEVRETAARHLVYALGYYEKGKSLMWRRNIPQVDKFWKEFNRSYSRKLRRKIYIPV